MNAFKKTKQKKSLASNVIIFSEWTDKSLCHQASSELGKNMQLPKLAVCGRWYSRGAGEAVNSHGADFCRKPKAVGVSDNRYDTMDARLPPVTALLRRFSNTS